MFTRLQFFLSWLEKKQKSILVEVFMPIGVGIGMGGLFLFSRTLSSKWLLATLMIITGITFLFLIDMVYGPKGKRIDYIKKFLLVAFVIDVPLGLDFAPFTQEGHQGGPAGLEISLMTFVIVLGYAFWLLERASESNKNPIRYFPLVTVPALLFWATNLLSLFFAQFIQFSLFEMWLVTQFILAYFYFINHLQTEDDLRLILTALTVMLILQSLLMLAQYFIGFGFDIGLLKTYSQEDLSGGVRVGGTLGDASAGGTWLMSTLCIMLGILLSNRKLINTPLLIIATGLGVIALVGTGSRAGWLALGMGGSVILLVAFLTPTLRRTIDSKILFFLIIGGFLVGLLFGGTIITRFTADDGGSAESRTPLADLAFNIIEDYPYGVGLNNYGEVMFSSRYVPPSLVGSSSIYVVHNKFLLIWAETGLWGAVAFGLLILASLVIPILLFKTKTSPPILWLSLALSVSLLGYTQNMTTEPFGTRLRAELLWVLLALSVGVYHLAIQQAKKEVAEESKLNQLSIIAAPGALN